MESIKEKIKDTIEDIQTILSDTSVADKLTIIGMGVIEIGALCLMIKFMSAIRMMANATDLVPKICKKRYKNSMCIYQTKNCCMSVW